MLWLRISSILLISLLIALPAQAKTEPTFRTYLTGEGSKNRPRAEAISDFECSDTIYVVVEVTAPERQNPPGEHVLLVDWFNPGGDLEQKARNEFKSYGASTRLWVWLRLSGSTGAAIGQMFDPSFGMGEFIGKWRAVVRIDGEKVDTHEFDVLC